MSSGEVVLPSDHRPLGRPADVSSPYAPGSPQTSDEPREHPARFLATSALTQLDDTLRGVPALVLVLEGPDHVVAFANEECQRLIGDRRLVGKPVRDALPELADQGFFELLDGVLSSGEPKVGRGMRMLRSQDRSADASLEERFVDFVHKPLIEPDGSRSGILLVGVDVTERMRAETALRESEQRSRELAERLRLAVESADVGAWDWNPIGGLATWDTRCKALLGFALDDRVDYDLFLERVHPDDRERAHRTVQAALNPSSDGEFSLDCRVLLPDRTVRWVNARGRALFAGEGSARRALRVIGTVLDITERQLATERLARSDERYRILAELLPVQVWTARPDGTLDYVSSRLVSYFGVTSERLLGRGWQSVVHPDDLSRVVERWGRSLAAGKPYEFEFRLRAADGSYRWHLARIVPRRDAAGRVVQWLGTNTDIQERKEAAEAVRENQERLRAALDASGTGTFRWDIRTNALDWDDNLHRLLGLPPRRTTRSLVEFLSLVHREDRERVIAAYRRCADAGADFDEEFRVVWPDGTVRWLDDKGKTILDEDGRPLYMTGACVDVTTRRLMEDQLRDSEARFRQLADAMPQIVWTARPDGRLDYFNRKGYEITGAAEGDTRNEAYLPILHPDDRQRKLDFWDESVRTGRPFQIEYRFKIPETGEFRWHLGRALPARDAAGNIVRWYGTSTDIHDQKMLEEARDRALSEARVERERLYEVFMQAPAAISVLHGPEHVIVSANPLYLQIVGNRDVLGRPVRETLPELQGQGFFELLDQVYATGQPFVGTEMPATLGREGDAARKRRYFNFVYQPLKDADGKVYGIMAHAVEVTEQVRARQEAEGKAEELARLTEALRRSNRELDQFAYVASHDLKAPLRGIANLAQWIEEDVADRLPDASKEHLRLLQGRVHRIQELIDGILTYSRAARARAKPEPTDVGRLARDVVELLSPQNVSIELAPDLPTVMTERVPLQQVLMNLISNAVKHGRAQTPRIEVGWRDAGSLYEFHVRDNGPGIPPEYHERIWGLFQKLEPRDKVEGAGIGLAVVRKIIAARGGKVWLESAPGAGAAFHFTWPKTPAAEA